MISKLYHNNEAISNFLKKLKDLKAICPIQRAKGIIFVDQKIK